MRHAWLNPRSAAGRGWSWHVCIFQGKLGGEGALCGGCRDDAQARVGCVALSMRSTYRESEGDAVWTVTFFITALSSSHQHCGCRKDGSTITCMTPSDETLCDYSKHQSFFSSPEGFKCLSKGQDSVDSSFPLHCFGGLKAAQISWQSLTHLHLLLVLFDSSPKSQSEAAEQRGRAQQSDAGARHELNHPVIIIRVGVHHSWGVRTPPWPVSLSAGVLCRPNRSTQKCRDFTPATM